jgi:hypothetical protein
MSTLDSEQTAICFECKKATSELQKRITTSGETRKFCTTCFSWTDLDLVLGAHLSKFFEHFEVTTFKQTGGLCFAYCLHWSTRFLSSRGGLLKEPLLGVENLETPELKLIQDRAKGKLSRVFLKRDAMAESIQGFIRKTFKEASRIQVNHNPYFLGKKLLASNSRLAGLLCWQGEGRAGHAIAYGIDNDFMYVFDPNYGVICLPFEEENTLGVRLASDKPDEFINELTRLYWKYSGAPNFYRFDFGFSDEEVAKTLMDEEDFF